MEARHPQAPHALRYRVRHPFRDAVARRFGSFYAVSTLSPRSGDGACALFSPVVVGPGDIPLFAWPPVELEEQWLEPA